MNDLDKDYQGKIEDIAGDWIEQGQIKNCLSGEPFWIMSETGEEEWLEPVSKQEFEHYYNIFDNIELLGLPHGQGWANEQEWLVYLYKSFKRCYDNCKSALEIKAINNGKNPTNN